MSNFSFDTIKDFDNHINNSILGYDLLYKLIINILPFFIDNKSVVIDLGCTSGKLLKEIKNIHNVNIYGYDITDANFLPDLNLIKQDITEDSFIIPEANIILCIFTLQFLSFQDREKVLSKIKNSLKDGGVCIICEKELATNGLIQEIFTFSNYSYKRNSFSSDDILNKEEDLRKIMKCSLEGYNEEKIKKYFNHYAVFFKSLNFKGYLCMK